MAPRSTPLASRLVTLSALAIALLSCARPTVTFGEECEINSQCADPLVCVLDTCRRACITTRDCGAGLTCIVADGTRAELGGGCQLPEEVRCTLTSECGRASLVCQNGTCTTPCREDRDCAAGAHCTPDGSGTMACFDQGADPCVYDSDCPAPLVCDPDQVCRLECAGDRDCDAPRVCVQNLCQLPDASSATADGGT